MDAAIRTTALLLGEPGSDSRDHDRMYARRSAALQSFSNTDDRRQLCIDLRD